MSKKHSEKYQKAISGGIVIGKKVLTVAARVLVELMEQVEDMEYMRTHCYAVIGKDVRSERYESELGRHLHEEKMKRQAIKRLAMKKFIKQRKEGEREIFELTEDGKVQALKILIAQSGVLLKDGRMCLVSFDIPEAARTARVAFRRFLKSVGFNFVQGSVWSIEKDINNEMRALVGLLKIGRWVEIFIANK